MRAFYTVLALAAGFIPSALLAQSISQRFTRAGVTYSYTVKQDAHGRRIIDGRSLNDGAAFHLIVDGDRVDGVSGGQPVSFRTPATGNGVALAAR